MRDFVAERNAKSEIVAVFKLFYNEFKIMLQSFLLFFSVVVVGSTFVGHCINWGVSCGCRDYFGGYILNIPELVQSLTYFTPT